MIAGNCSSLLSPIIAEDIRFFYGDEESGMCRYFRIQFWIFLLDCVVCLQNIIDFCDSLDKFMQFLWQDYQKLFDAAFFLGLRESLPA